MNEQKNKIEREQLNSPDKIDGRVWLRDILRRNKPKYLWAIEDKNKLDNIRKAISENEIAFLNIIEPKSSPDQLLEEIKQQKILDITRVCPGQARLWIGANRERSISARNRT